MLIPDKNIADPVGPKHISDIRKMLSEVFRDMFPKEYILTAEDIAEAEAKRCPSSCNRA